MQDVPCTNSIDVVCNGFAGVRSSEFGDEGREKDFAGGGTLGLWDRLSIAVDVEG